jgi:competence protein ComEA
MSFITRCLAELNRHIRDLFGFSKAETKGVRVLLVLLWFAITLPPVIRWYEATYGRPDHELDRNLLDSLVVELAQASTQPNLPTSADVPTQQGSLKVPPTNLPPPSEAKPFDINQAEKAVLARLPSIKPVLARRILAYRDKLGGFVTKKQYQEVYGITKKALASMEQFAYIAPGFRPKQLDINHAGFRTLLNHPYLSYEVVRSIVHMRKKSKRFSRLDVLLTEHIVDSTTFEKIQPYLSLVPL